MQPKWQAGRRAATKEDDDDDHAESSEDEDDSADDDDREQGSDSDAIEDEAGPSRPRAAARLNGASADEDEEEDEEGDDDEEESEEEITIPVPVAMWDFDHCDPKRCSGKKLSRHGLCKDMRIGQRFRGIVLT